MNKQQFLDELRTELNKAQFEQTDEAVKFFEEMLLDRAEEENISEDEAARRMPSPEEAARQILHYEGKARQASAGAGCEEKTHGEVRITKTIKNDGIYKINISASNTRINISAYGGSDIKISYTENTEAGIQYDFSVENGEISLRRIEQNMFIWGFVSFKRSPVEVLLPQEITARCSFKTSNAGIRAKNLKTWGEVRLKTSNASAIAQNLEASQIDMETSNGSINASGLKLSGSACFKSSNASFDLSEISCRELYADTSNGKISAENIKTDEKLKLTTSNGGIKIDELKSPYIILNTIHGSIKGFVSGSIDDYSIISSTSLGKSNLPEYKELGDKKLKASTSMGNIDIDFI